MVPQEVTWGDLAAVGDVDTDDALQLWARLREAADDELGCGRRGAKVADDNGNPYSLAQYLAIRDSFADQWQPQGGIEAVPTVVTRINDAMTNLGLSLEDAAIHIAKQDGHL